MSKSTLEELQKLGNDRVLNSEARNVLFKKMAATGMDSKTVNKMLSDAQKAFARARQEYNDANAQLAGLQQRVDTAQTEMSGARKMMMDINHAAQTMHLTGAEGLKQEKGGEYSYVVDGDRMYADTQDFENITLTPWKEYLASKNEADDLGEDEGDEGNEESEDRESGEDIVSSMNDELFDGDAESEEEVPVDEVNESFEDESPADDSFDPYSSFTGAAQVEKSIITKVAKKKFR